MFHRLAADVLAGRYAPGERLPTQRALAAALGVNMASVREGIKRLEQLKLVDVRQGDAMRVRDWRAHGGLDVLVHALGGGAALDDEVMRSVMEARGLLLADAARLAAERRDETQAALLGAAGGRGRGRAGRRGRPGRGLRVLRDADRRLGEPRAAARRELDPRPLLRPARRLPRARARPGGARPAATRRPPRRSPTGDGEAAARAVRELAAAQEAAWLEGLA